MSSIVEIISPAWILIGLLGAFWAGFAAVLVPPPPRAFPRAVVAAIVGATLGQAVGTSLLRPSLMVGDVQVVAVSVGALLAVAIVRGFSA